MKYFAVVLGFYLMGLATAPLVEMVRSKFAASCQQSCSEPVPENNDGCEKRECCAVSCCYVTLMFLVAETRYAFTAHFAQARKHNFKSPQDFSSFSLFDIWHPPKLA